MTRRRVTIPGDYFEALYASSPDPWHFATSDYERRKYAKTLDAIGHVAGEAFEIGCSIGIFTRALAARCSSEFHSPHRGHWPCHFGDWPPHSVHV